METKKSKRASLENYRTIFLQIGIILTLSAILFAFEWKTAINHQIDLFDGEEIDIAEYNIPRTPRKEEKRKVKPPTPLEQIIIADDDVVIEDEPLFKDEEEWTENDFPEWIEPEEEVDEPIFFAEVMPTFQGKGVSYFRTYIANNIKFPRTAIENGIAGTVFVEFVVDKDGSISDIKVIRDVHPIVDEAVIEVIKNSPKWEPGINNGKFVKVKFTIAIKFDLI